LENLKILSQQKKVNLDNLREDLSKQKSSKTTLLSYKVKLVESIDKQTISEGIYNEIEELYKIASGQLAGTSREKFENYVLAVFLDEVILYANKRLEELSQGRYLLSRKDDTLNFDILDTHTNINRDVSTLSGGETFFTSLALALGLADIASSKRGYIKLDSLFIDEGFGTLDPETLDLAIRTLVELEGGSRMIGIISHVAELKERIEAQLEIVKGKNGSKVKTAFSVSES
jgi:DNA repair protein SbcC/Rad50